MGYSVSLQTLTVGHVASYQTQRHAIQWVEGLWPGKIKRHQTLMMGKLFGLILHLHGLLGLRQSPPKIDILVLGITWRRSLAPASPTPKII